MPKNNQFELKTSIIAIYRQFLEKLANSYRKKNPAFAKNYKIFAKKY